MLHPFMTIAYAAYNSQVKTVKFVIKKDKSKDEIAYIKKSLAITHAQSIKLSRVLPFFEKLAVITKSLDELIGSNKEKHIALFLLNNYELRPGGGFVGSVGKLTFRDYTLTSFEIEDVYEIDGQVTLFQEPDAIAKKYLNQSHEFLRDSNFSPSFDLNVVNALPYFQLLPKFAVEYEGAIGITTSAFEDLLRLTGPVRVTGFRDDVNADNFFRLTQEKIETEFFPGSNQKKNILHSMRSQIVAKIEDLHPLIFLPFFQKNLDAKHIIFYSATPQVQKVLTSLNWTGTHTNVYGDYVHPVSSNVGVNKVNKFIDTRMELQIVRNPPINKRVVKITFRNNSTKHSKLEGTYKNYFQLYVPIDSELREVRLNNEILKEDIPKKTAYDNAVFGVYLEIPPSSERTLTFTYHSKSKTPFDFPYPITIQKQIGEKDIPLFIVYANGDKTETKQLLLQKDQTFTFE